jgi:sterol desaturase/sphingolipid hydroxylase (fatty acid hydroxylase superfamily)
MATGNVIMVICLSRFTLLDLIGAYLVHLVEHKIKFLWRFHLIHHTDVWVDTTSANRHHPGESVIRFAFTMGVLIVGSPMWLVFLYQTLSVIATHSIMLILPKWDTILSYFIVSPDMHKIIITNYLTDSNYGNIFRSGTGFSERLKRFQKRTLSMESTLIWKSKNTIICRIY